MENPPQYGLQQARAELPHIAEQAQAGYSSLITKHGRPIAVVVPIGQWNEAQMREGPMIEGFLALRGSGRSIWPESAAETVETLRNEWD